MKTKTLLLICLFMGIGMSRLLAQNGNNGNGVVSIWDETSDWQDVIAEDGTVLDVLEYTLQVHAQIHYKNGEIFRVDYEGHGTALSSKTGEIFKMSEIGKQPVYSWDPFVGFDYFRVHLIGDHGTHLKIEATLDFSTMEYTINNVFWPGDKYWDGN